jgi:hypothetical protein
MFKTTIRASLVATALALSPLPSLADADRPVTAEETRQIEAVLRREGFSQWGKIEFDDGRFEVDDAVAADGRRFDLKLSGVDFVIVDRDLED